MSYYRIAYVILVWTCSRRGNDSSIVTWIHLASGNRGESVNKKSFQVKIANKIAEVIKMFCLSVRCSLIYHNFQSDVG